MNAEDRKRLEEIEERYRGVEGNLYADPLWLLSKVRELMERQKWIDEVGRPAHPDDERPWCSAYLDMREKVREQEKELAQARERMRELEKVYSWDAPKEHTSLGEVVRECYCPVCGYLRKHERLTEPGGEG